MASNSQLSSKLHHLWAASHALAATSPAASAHMMSVLLTTAADRALTLSETALKGVCKACGTVLVPGLNSHVHTTTTTGATTTTGRLRMGKGAGTGSASVSALRPGAGGSGNRDGSGVAAGSRPQKCKLRVVYECRTCGRSSTHDVPPSAQRKSRSKAKSKSVLRARARLSSSAPAPAPTSSTSTSTATSTAPPQSQNANSKKRAKSRKGNSLSDLLAAKKKHDSSVRAAAGGFGLDLMDLMKTG